MSGKFGPCSGWESNDTFQVRKQVIIKTYLDFNVAALTGNTVIYSLPKKAIVLGSRLKVSELFSGGAIDNYFLSVGISGKTQELLPEYEVKSITIGDQEYCESSVFQSFDYNNTTSLLLTARSVGANLNIATSGSVIVEIFYLS